MEYISIKPQVADHFLFEVFQEFMYLQKIILISDMGTAFNIHILICAFYKLMYFLFSGNNLSKEQWNGILRTESVTV